MQQVSKERTEGGGVAARVFLNECLDLAGVEPQTMPAGAAIDFDWGVITDGQGVESASAAWATPLASLTLAGRADHLVQRFDGAAGSLVNLLQLPGIEPGAVAGRAMVDLDTFELQDDHGLLTDRAHCFASGLTAWTA